MRNTPLRAFVKKSPYKSGIKDAAKVALKTVKPFLKGTLKRVAGPVSLMLGSVKTASADQPGTGTHGGKKTSHSGDIRDMQKSAPKQKKS